jgi:Asparaginase
LGWLSPRISGIEKLPNRYVNIYFLFGKIREMLYLKLSLEFNACYLVRRYGSNLTESGTVEMDAGIMDGTSLLFGAVGAVSGTIGSLSVKLQKIETCIGFSHLLLQLFK